MTFKLWSRRLRKSFMGLAFCWPLQTPAADGDGHIRTLASSCTICHQHSEKAARNLDRQVIPDLAGMEGSKFIQRMKAYQSSSEAHEVMVQHAKGLNESEIQQLAMWFARQATRGHE